MNNGNTINPGQFSNMADQTDFENFDFENFDPENFNPEDFDSNGLIDLNFGSNLPGVPFNESLEFPNTSFNEPQEPVSTQQSYLTSDFTYTQAAPTLAPQPGPVWHFEIGWYYPAPGPAPIPVQQPMSTFTPYTPYNAPPIAESTQMPEPSLPSTGKNKRKYGPGVYGEEQAKRRAIGDDSGPRPVSRESVDFHVPGRKIKKMKGTASKPKKGSQKGGKQSDLNKAIIKSCRCPAAEAVKNAKIRRPANCFMLFRADFGSDLATSKGGKRGIDNPNVSTTAGGAWRVHREAKDETWAKYKEMANAIDRQHKEAHPNYNYKPIAGIRARFGRPDCTCGAYGRNSAALKKLRAGSSNPEDTHNAAIGEGEDEVDDEDEEEVDSYVMPTTRSMSRSNSLASAPIDQTISFPFDYNLDYNLDGYNFGDGSGNVPDLDYQNGAAESHWNTQLNFANAAESTYVPPVTRRSTRIGQQAVNYIEQTEEELDGEGDVEMSNTAPREKRRPSPITTSRNASPESDGPASCTRSKSVSFDENLFLEASPTNSLFGDDFEDVGENIIVATPMTAMSNVSPKTRTGLALPIMQSRATRSQSRGSR
ncbi:hypothetical protein Q7P36_009834 [Cladosporium allicinum]